MKIIVSTYIDEYGMPIAEAHAAYDEADAEAFVARVGDVADGRARFETFDYDLDAAVAALSTPAAPVDDSPARCSCRRPEPRYAQDWKRLGRVPFAGAESDREGMFCRCLTTTPRLARQAAS